MSRQMSHSRRADRRSGIVWNGQQDIEYEGED